MVTSEGARIPSPWEEFELRFAFGKHANNHKESKKARRKRLKKTTKTPLSKKKKKTKKEIIKELYQSHFTSQGGITYNDAEVFADTMIKKPPCTFRCGMQNIHLLPESARNYKSRQLVQHIRDAEYDVFCMNEVGLYWDKLNACDQWAERAISLPDSTAIFANNTTEPQLSTKLQYGGVGIVATGEAKHRITSRGKDSSGLGRWVWIRLTGKEGHHVRILTLYRPCESGGASTVFQQHSRGLTAKDDLRNPRTAILKDVLLLVDTWKELGDHVIIGMDANEDVRKGETNDLFSAAGFREVILDLHNDLSPPATYNRNTKRQPIDGFWATTGISITRGGYLAFGEGCPSDHRVIWFDISYSVAFGQRLGAMPPLQPKRLKAKDPRLTKKYHKNVLAKMLSSGFKKRFDAFKLSSQLDWNAGSQIAFNKLNNESTAIRKQVEGTLRKLCMGGMPWSTELQILRDTIELWAMVVRRKTGVKVSVLRIRRFLLKVPAVRTVFSCTLDEAILARNLAFKTYKAVTKKEATKMRQKFQGTLAEAIALKNNSDIETEAKKLRTHEKQRRQGRNVKRMLGKLGNSRVTKLFYTDDDGTRVQCDTQLSMELACFEENETRFSQSEQTPPMLPPTLDELGILGDTDAIEEILAGNYVPPSDTDQYMAELLEEMRMPKAILKSIQEEGLISTTISEEENKSGWKKRKLASAEASGLTMDHHAAGCEDPELNRIDTLFRQLPYHHGFSPDSWQRITDVEILKKAGVYDVELMRTIQLMNAEFNMNNKKLGRDVMAFAERHEALAPEQFGSRKNHESIMAALNKRLTMDLLRQKRLAGALCANDAKSCYDRIVHNVAVLAIRRLGMAAAPIRSMFETIQRSKHHVSTAFGISEKSYGGQRDPPLQGACQGNGGGPAIWAVISTVIIATMATHGHGFNILSAMSCILVSFVCYAFVDDTDVIQSASSTATPGEAVIADMQIVLDRWGGLLRATGGALVPKKSFWYAIDFRWNGCKWVYRTIDDMPGDILISDVDGARVILQRHEADVGKETLGVMQAMDGNNVAEIAHLLKKAVAFADSMRTGYLSKNDAWFALTATIMKTMEYPMASTTMTETEWNTIMTPILMSGLPRAGMDRRFPHAVLYGPTCLQGFGILHPWYHQEITHLLVCLKQTTLGGITGSLISASLEQLRLEIGLPGWLTDHDFSLYQGLATDAWITTAWKFASSFKIEIRDSERKLLQRRTNDLFLMKEFGRSFTGQDLLDLNICRMFLHSVTLADICTVDGTTFTLDAWQGRRDPSSNAELSWSRVQKRLPERYWTLWQKALRKCFQSPRSARASRELLDKLGRWSRFPERWQWFYSPQEDRLYKLEGWMWRAYPVYRVRTSSRLGSTKYRRSDEVTRIRPKDLIPASVHTTKHWVTKEASMEILDQPVEEVPTPKTVETIRLIRPPGFQWAITEMSVEDNGLTIAEALQAGNAIAVSDGSFKESQSTAAFVIEGAASYGRLVGVNVIPGEEDSQSPYRSELGGVAGILEALHCICIAHSITKGHVTVGLDGEQAMKEAFGTWPLDPRRPDYDMLQHIRGMIRESPLTFESRWIESHQDDFKSLKFLDRWSLLNVECDGLAKSFWNTNALAKSWVPNIQFGFEKWSLWIGGKKLSTVDKKKLYAFAFAERTQTYWHRKSSLTPELITSINWEACDVAMGSLPFGKKRWLLKHATGWCGVGRRELIRCNQDHDECPRCGESESARHVVECKGTGADLTFTLAVKKLETSMTVLDTAPHIQKAILKRIQQWRKFGDRDLPRFTDFDMWGTQHAVKEQDKLGWYQFLLGRFGRKWSDAQQRYIDSLQKKNTGRRWTISLIQKAIDVAWDMWEQRNDIKYNTLHPRAAAAVIDIKVQLQFLYRKGKNGFLAQDRLLFSKTETTLLKGEPSEMLQWITSVLNAKRRAAQAKNDEAATLQAERDLMKTWLQKK
jgi:hypothetical protein